MPRTYSFDHFTAAKPAKSKQAKPGELERSARGKRAAPAGELHYGQKHARTVELYREHEALHEPAPAVPPARRAPSWSSGVLHGTPIGALSAQEEPLPASRLRDALEDAGRRARAIARGARELAAIGMRLLRLPLDVAKLALRRPASERA
ncbi:MAG: hypothetical protein HYZ28_01520 [Myxococcales bacterium]|nr:hypothetical protein [Myxococcales bacterium]